jgi:hypothetical protein
MTNYVRLALLIGCAAAPMISRAETPAEIRTHVVGRVTTPEGKPIVGAIVWWQGPTPSGVNAGSGSPGTTDRDGTYRIPVLVSEKNETSGEQYMLGSGFDVVADGYVRFQEQLRIEEKVVTDPRADQSRDFSLQPGELIEGTVKRGDAKKFEGFLHTITVRGPSYRQVYVSDQQGNFRFWVPKGTYSLSVLDAKTVGLNQMRRELGYAAKSAEKPLVVEGVVAGGPKVRITD